MGFKYEIEIEDVNHDHVLEMLEKIKKRKDKLKNLMEIQVLRAFIEGYKLACIMHSPSGYDEHCELELIEALETFEKMKGQIDDDS